MNSDLRHLSCRATVAHEPADAAAFGHAFMEVATGLGLRPGRMITTGKGRPGSIPWVWALNALQNSMMFRPR